MKHTSYGFPAKIELRPNVIYEKYKTISAQNVRSKKTLI